MFNSIRAKIESKRYSTNSFWSTVIRVKDKLASSLKNKSETEASRLKKEMIFYGQFIVPNSIVFDIGANHGQKAKTFLKLGAKVIAVEPQLECVQDLKKNLGSHKNITIIAKGCGETEQFKTMYISSDSDMTSTFSEDWQSSRFKDIVSWNQKREIELTTIEKLVEEFGVPDFCKIDVEGFEPEVIKGLKSKINVIGFEFAEESLVGCLASLEILDQIGFKEFNFASDESFNFEFEKWQNMSEFKSYLKETCDVNRKEFWGDIYAR